MCRGEWGANNMSGKVLIVEDEQHIAESLTFLLEREGFEVTAITDGDEALDTVSKVKPDVLVLDVMLPGMNGFEIARGLRHDPVHSKLPILMLTAKGQRRDRQTAVESGADIFMSKPFSNSEVVEAVRKLAG
jgi:DNA-binding response OmpR family regulator